MEIYPEGQRPNFSKFFKRSAKERELGKTKKSKKKKIPLGSTNTKELILHQEKINSLESEVVYLKRLIKVLKERPGQVQVVKKFEWSLLRILMFSIGMVVQLSCGVGLCFYLKMKYVGDVTDMTPKREQISLAVDALQIFLIAVFSYQVYTIVML
jgi:hypothetical protein